MGSVASNWSFVQLLEFFGPKILFSILCGGLVGLERELKNKPAGIKTNILICLGSSLYTSVSVLISTSFADSGHYGDPARVAAQIVGHRVFEERQPSMVDHPAHFLLGPMFVMAKLFIALGFRRDLAAILAPVPTNSLSTR